MRREECRSPSKFSTTSTRCSNTLGPATLPSFVTCPTSRIGMPVFLASAVSAAVTARDCATPPATPSTPGACMVCTESTMSSEGFSCSTCPNTTSRSDSAARNSVSFSAPVRCARIRTCPTDSSAVTYKAVRVSRVDASLSAGCVAHFAATSSNNVDLPTPGSPASNTTEPGTRPLPSTRSSSPIPVDVVVELAGSIRTIGNAGAVGVRPVGSAPVNAATAALPPPFLLVAATRFSSNVPHEPHSGQRPNHFAHV